MSRFEHKNSETCTTNVLKSSQKSLQSPSLNLSTFIDDQGQFISAFSPSVCPAHRLSWSQSDVWHMNLRSVCCDFSVTFSSFPPDCGTWSVSLVETNSGRAWRVCAALALIVLATYFKYLPSADTERSRFGIKCFIYVKRPFKRCSLTLFRAVPFPLTVEIITSDSSVLHVCWKSSAWTVCTFLKFNVKLETVEVNICFQWF